MKLAWSEKFPHFSLFAFSRIRCFFVDFANFRVVAVAQRAHTHTWCLFLPLFLFILWTEDEPFPLSTAAAAAATKRSFLSLKRLFLLFFAAASSSWWWLRVRRSTRRSQRRPNVWLAASQSRAPFSPICITDIATAFEEWKKERSWALCCAAAIST